MNLTMSINLLALNDEELMLELQSGNEEAFVILVKKYTNKFYALAYRMVGQAEAEDLVQEAFLKLLDQPHKWNRNKGAKFSTWFYTVIINMCKDYNKKKKPIQISDDFEKASDANLEELIEQKDQRRYVDKCLLELSENQRISVYLCFYQGLSNQEAADIMGLKLKALQSLLMRAKVALKEKARIYNSVVEAVR